ncbi:MAG: hypothetical protein J2P25_14690 [Nocardiopsaceae bacterium]|nr:hypothetical protein [Nocardiopsaceae bacterium]
MSGKRGMAEQDGNSEEGDGDAADMRAVSGGEAGRRGGNRDAGTRGGDRGAGLVGVAAPLPGTFYRAPRPGAAPFVEVGDAVGEDTVVAIVETMKLMNSVPAGTRGRVAEILLANADPVAQGATLMLIDPEPA